jgi:hypothetical protein
MKKTVITEKTIQDILEDQYKKVKVACVIDPKSESSGEAINLFARTSLDFLVNTCEKTALVSKVGGKTYFSFKREGILSRPINDKYFIVDLKKFDGLWKKWLKADLTDQEFEILSYTLVLAPAAAMELFDRQNKKGPATYFECYINYVFSRVMQENPTKKVKLPIADHEALMTMDLLFNTSEDRNVHVPIKMSTRERVVQAWAHQRLLNAAYGENKYTGVMVLFSETKLDVKKLEVVEICVPDQWLIYQSHLAKMTRIYYFDPPERYLALTKKYPDLIQIKKFGEFFSEVDEVLPKTPGI